MPSRGCWTMSPRLNQGPSGLLLPAPGLHRRLFRARHRKGGVLRSPAGQITDWFQATVPPDVVQSWLQSDTLLLAVSVAAALWGSLLKDWPVIWWIDNDAARHCLISARGYPDSNFRLVQTVLVCEQHFRIQSWFARVPSISNPADAPSRGENASFLAHAAEAEIKVGWLRCLARGAVPQVFLQSTH